MVFNADGNFHCNVWGSLTKRPARDAACCVSTMHCRQTMPVVPAGCIVKTQHGASLLVLGFSGQQIERMRDEWQHGLQRLICSGGVAGKVEHK